MRHIFEVPPSEQGRYPDEPLSGDTNDPDDRYYLINIFTTNQPETIDMVYQWRQVLDDFRRENGGEERIMLTEAYMSLDILAQYFGNGTHNGSHVPFNFRMLKQLFNESNANDYIARINDFMKIVPQYHVANWVVRFHL